MKSIKLLLFTVISLNLFAQKPPDKTPFGITISNGINFIQNDSIASAYHNNTKYFIGVGFESMSIKESSPRFAFNYKYCNFGRADSFSLTQHLFFVGVVFPLYSTAKTNLISKFGVVSAFNKGETSFFPRKSLGVEMGLGVERELIEDFRIFFDLSYNYQRYSDIGTNLDMVKLAFGMKFRL